MAQLEWDMVISLPSGTRNDIPSTSHLSGSILHPHMLIYGLIGWGGLSAQVLRLGTWRETGWHLPPCPPAHCMCSFTGKYYLNKLFSTKHWRVRANGYSQECCHVCTEISGSGGFAFSGDRFLVHSTSDYSCDLQHKLVNHYTYSESQALSWSVYIWEKSEAQQRQTGEVPKVTHWYNGRKRRALLKQDMVWLGHLVTEP